MRHNEWVFKNRGCGAVQVLIDPTAFTCIARITQNDYALLVSRITVTGVTRLRETEYVS